VFLYICLTSLDAALSDTIQRSDAFLQLLVFLDDWMVRVVLGKEGTACDEGLVLKIALA
jgi:hypothetical protein